MNGGGHFINRCKNMYSCVGLPVNWFGGRINILYFGLLMKLRFLLILVTLGVVVSCKKSKLDEPAPPPPPPPPAIKTPKLITDSISGLTVYSVILGGKIVDTGGSAITEVGIVVGLNSAPTIAANLNKFKSQPDSAGSFTNTIIGVPISTTFYVRVYAINAHGVGYGNEVKFTSPTGNVLGGGPPTILTTQQEVNDFGAKKYNILTNGIEINGRGITDLSPLKSIVVLGGALNVKNTSLENLKGLDSLEVIGGTFFNTSSIEHNFLLKDLTGLERVKKIAGSLVFSWNIAMVNLNGLKSLAMLHGSSLGIYDCPSIQNLNGLEKLTFLDGDINLYRNGALTDLKGLRNLQTITGWIRLRENHMLVSLDGFEKLTSLHTLELTDNARIANLNGFKNLTNLTQLQLDLDPMLSDLSAMKNLRSIGGLLVKRCNSVMDLTAFSNLESINGLEVSFNPNIKDLKGLEKIRSIQTMIISSNNSLKNLKGLDSLRTIAGDANSLSISYNPSLVSLTGLESLRTAQGQVWIAYNPAQMDHCALKPFLMQYTGNNFSFVPSGGTPLSIAQLIASCP
jgi:hypothetical protein